MKKKRLYVLVLCVALLVPAAQAVIVGSDADTYLRDDTARGSYEFMDVRGGSIDFAGYLRFDLSGYTAADVASAELVLTVSGGASRNDTLVTGRFGLYGLSNAVGNTPQDWDEATLTETGTNPVGAEWDGVVPLVSADVVNLDMESVAGITETLSSASADPGTTITISGAPLVAFLEARIADGGLVTFILANNDGSDRGYGIATKENATEAWRPALVIPEPATMILLGLGGLVLRRRR